MSPARDEPREETILVLAPTGRDAALAVSVLEEHGFGTVTCPDIDALCLELDRGVGAVLLAEEALVPATAPRLTEALRRQPPWSDVPVLVFSGGEPSTAAGRRTLAVITPLGNVAILDRPVRVITLVSALRVALRARHRQYEVRDLVTRLERSVQDRDHFLAMLGHELRNPLAVIVMGVQILHRTAAESEQARHRLEAIDRQSRHLARLLESLLDVSRVTSGRIQLHRTPVDSVALVERCTDDAGVAVQAQGLDLQVAAGPEPIVVDGDAVRLEQIVSNLVTNAVKYTLAGGSVRVSVTRAGEQAVIAVEDTGIGIAKEMLGRILEPFTQVEGSLHRAGGGLGLGLSVVQSLTELHGGALGVESPGLGLGSRFTVTLPLLPASAPASAAPPLRDPRVRPRAALRVVVVEDNADVRENLRILLETAGHRVVVAHDGPSGVAAVLAEKPDAVLVDIGLPGMDGYGVARAIRGALSAGVFLIAFTGYGQREDELRAKEAGFDAHLTKPVQIEAVVALLDQAKPSYRADPAGGAASSDD